MMQMEQENVDNKKLITVIKAEKLIYQQNCGFNNERKVT